eukprot:379046_1
MAQLFPNATEIILSEISLQQLIKRKKDFAAAIMKYINDSHSDEGINVVKIIFESSTQVHRKENPTLKKLAKQYAPMFYVRGWNFEYSFRLQEKHNLIFTKKPLQQIMTGSHSNDEKKQLDEVKQHDADEEDAGCLQVFASVAGAISSKWKGTNIAYTTVTDKDSDIESYLDLPDIEINSGEFHSDDIIVPVNYHSQVEYFSESIGKITQFVAIPL